MRRTVITGAWFDMISADGGPTHQCSAAHRIGSAHTRRGTRACATSGHGGRLRVSYRMILPHSPPWNWSHEQVTPYSITTFAQCRYVDFMWSNLNSHTIFVWYMARLVFKTRDQKDMCYNEIGFCAQNINTILGLIVNTNRRAYAVI